MEHVKEHFQEAAEQFDRRVVKVIPAYPDMIEALVSALPFARNRKIRVVDLGCGTGTITKKLKERFPSAVVTCVDFSGNMLELAQNKLQAYKDVSFIESDCRHFEFSAGYDAVITSLTLHHLRTGSEKKALYKKIFKGLRKNGVFYSADLALGANKYLQRMYLEKWAEILRTFLTADQIRQNEKNYKREDHPFTLAEEFAWLKQAGFRDLDVIWKTYHFAVFGGVKK